MKKDVIVNFLIEATDGSSLTFMTSGKLVENSDYKSLTFIEESDSKLKTKLDIYPDHIVLERSGALKMIMEFRIGQTTYVKMKTNYKFELTMACVTESMLIESNLVDIIYQTDTDREHNMTHHLQIKYE